MRVAPSGRFSTNIRADDGPFESCGNMPSVGGNNRQHPAVELGHFQLVPVFTGFEGPFESGYAYGLRRNLATSTGKG